MSISPNKPTDWVSPIKSPYLKRTAHYASPQSNSRRRKLFDENGDTPKSTILQLTRYNFFQTQTPDTCPDYYQLQEQVDQIEAAFALTPLEQGELIKDRISRCLENPDLSTEQKHAELGMMLFYLDRDQQLPDALSLVEHRSIEIDQNVEDLLAEHHNSYISPRIPSGKSHYLLRAFAHMTITSTQNFNRGGVLALNQILNDPSLKIATYLQPEHRAHLCAVIDALLEDRRIPSLFLQQIQVHGTLRDLIRWDLKLPPKAPITAHHVYLSVVMSLFFDLRQESLPNCYAIASLLYITEQAPYEYLQTLVQWLSNGTISPSTHGPKVPISLLIKTRLPGHRELEVFLSSQKGATLTPVRHLCHTLNVTPNFTGSPKYQFLEQLLNTSLENQGEGKLKRYAKHLYAAYKYNTLAHMQLALMEFTAMNNIVEKREFLDLLISVCKLEKSSDAMRSPEEIAYRKELSFHLRRQVRNRIWFVNESDSMENRGLTNFPGDQRALQEILHSSVGVYFEVNGKLEPIRSFTSLREAVYQIFQESHAVAAEQFPESFSSEIEEEIFSDAFLDRITNFCAKNLKHLKVPASLLASTDLLLLKQQGASFLSIVDKLYGVKMGRIEFRSSTPRKFSEELISKLQEINPGLFHQSRRIILCTSGIHVWTLNPTYWKDLVGIHDSSSHLETEIYQPAQEVLDEQLPEVIYRGVIDRYCGRDQRLKNQMGAFFEKFPELTYGDFRYYLFANCAEESLPRMREIVDQEFGKVLPQIFNLQNLLAPWLSQTKSWDEWKLVQEFGEKPLPPYQLARIIAKHLLQEGVAIVDPFELECAICRYACMPIALHLGDTNWTEESREDFPHSELILRYNWASQTLSFFIREDSSESIEDEENYNKAALSYPTKYGTKAKNPMIFTLKV